MLHKAFLFLAFSCISLWARSQESTLTLRDARDGSAVAYAHVVVKTLTSTETQTLVSDLEGRLRINSSKPMAFTVSALGYRLFSDTLQPGSVRTVKLEPSVYNMDEVVVTGQYTPEAVDKSIFKVKVIGARQIQQKASSNLGELMAGELNIRSSFDGALGARITMQGLGGEHIKFLIDGVPVIGRMNGDIDVGQLNLYNVKQIEVIEGPMSVIYGSNALAGVINVITGNSQLSLLTANASAYLESVGVYNFTSDLTYRKKKWMGSLAAARNFFDGFSLDSESRAQRWKPKRQYNADASVSYTSDELTAKLGASYFNEKLQDKGALMKPYFETARDSYFLTNRLTTKADLKARVAKDRYLTVLASYAWYNRIKNTYFIDLTTLNQNLTTNLDDQDTSTFGQYLLRAEFSKSAQNSKFNYQLGIDLNHETGFGKRILDNQQQIGDYAAFLSMKIKPAVRLMLQPGLRYGYNTKYAAPLVYSINVKWDIQEETSLRASYAKGFRAPSLKELYLDFVDVNHNIKGNPNLKAEDSQNLNLALRYHKEKPSYDYGAELNLFYNEIHNSITLATLDQNAALYTYLNFNEMITQGYQLSFNNRLYPWLEIKAGVGQTGRKQSTEQAPELDMVYSTDAMVTVNYLWQKADTRFGLYYKYTGDYPEVFADEQGNVSRIIMGDYHTMDLNVSRAFLQQRLQVQLGVKNLFNNTNITVSGDSSGGIHTGGGGGSSPVAWGRTFFVRLTYQFQQTGNNHEK